MKTKIALATAIFFMFAASAQSRDADRAAGEGPAMLYTAVNWGNSVDYGVSLMPVSAHKNMAACNAAKHDLVESVSADVRNERGLVCQEAKTSDEKALAQMLALQSQKK